MRRNTTIIDIAKHLGISPSAVSKALNDHPRISDKTKGAVLKTAKELDYQPNTLATGLRKGKSGLVGVLVPNISFGFFATVIKGIEETLSDNGYSVIISQSHDNKKTEESHLQIFKNVRVEGVIASLALNTRDYDHFERINDHCPLVVFDRTTKRLDVSTVQIDDAKGAEMAVDHLVTQGYKRIAHIAGQDHLQSYKDRITGYKKALERNGLTWNEDYLVKSSLTRKEGIEITSQLLGLPEPPDAIFASSDYPIIGALSVLAEKKIKVPDDFGLIGFSNEAYTSIFRPTISTVDQFSEQMGVLAAETIVKLLKTGGDKNSPALHNVIQPRLVIRESSLRKI